jgi:hypothetical protein
MENTYSSRSRFRERCVDAARTKPRFIEIKHEKRSGVPFTEEQLTAMRGGLTAEEYRWKLIRELLD